MNCIQPRDCISKDDVFPRMMYFQGGMNYRIISGVYFMEGITVGNLGSIVAVFQRMKNLGAVFPRKNEM